MMHYYQHNIADYRKDTGHLTLLEHGIYRQLLDSYYLDEKPIETQWVIRRLRITTDLEKSALQNVLDEFFVSSECGNFYSKPRCDEEINKYHAKVSQAKVNGSKGGRPKKPKKTKPVNSANPKKTGSKTNQKPLTINHKPITSCSEYDDAPDLNSVLKYFTSQGLSALEANKFYAYNAAKGWTINHEPMKDWQAAANLWISRIPEFDNPVIPPRPSVMDRLQSTDWAKGLTEGCTIDGN